MKFKSCFINPIYTSVSITVHDSKKQHFEYDAYF